MLPTYGEKSGDARRAEEYARRSVSPTAKYKSITRVPMFILMSVVGLLILCYSLGIRLDVPIFASTALISTPLR